MIRFFGLRDPEHIGTKKASKCATRFRVEKLLERHQWTPQLRYLNVIKDFLNILVPI